MRVMNRPRMTTNGVWVICRIVPVLARRTPRRRLASIGAEAAARAAGRCMYSPWIGPSEPKGGHCRTQRDNGPEFFLLICPERLNQQQSVKAHAVGFAPEPTLPHANNPSCPTLPHAQHSLMPNTPSCPTLLHAQHSFMPSTPSCPTLPHAQHSFMPNTPSCPTLLHA